MLKSLCKIVDITLNINEFSYTPQSVYVNSITEIKD